MAMAGARGLNSHIFCLLFLLSVLFFVVDSLHEEVITGKNEAATDTKLVLPNINDADNARKLLQYDDYGYRNRIGSECSKMDISISQGQTAPLPSGIPTYTVEILNACASGHSIYNIHISCGWFSSAGLVNPAVFRRINYDDCLVNNGNPLGPGQMLSFRYANTYPYPLTVTTADVV